MEVSTSPALGAMVALVLVAGSAFASGMSTIRGKQPQSTESSGIKPQGDACQFAPSDSCH